MADDPTQETSASEVVSPVPDFSNPSIPPNLPDVPNSPDQTKPEENPQTQTEQPAPVGEPPVPEPTPTVAPEPPPMDVPIPNFRFSFNGSFPVTFAFNAQATTDEMKSKFQQWEIAGHHGIDFGLPEGTEVVAVDSGKILQSSEDGDYGISVTIQHSWGQSLYAHLKETKVSEGQEVNSGDLIGISGQTGAAFGPHLHFGIKPNNPNETNGYLGFIDPTSYLPTISQTPNIPNPPNSPDNPVPEPEKPKEEPVPTQPEPELSSAPTPEPSINIDPVNLPTEEKPQPSELPQQPIQPPISSEPVIDETEIKKQVDQKFDTELEARRLKANEVRKDKRQEHLQAIEKLLQEKKEITNQDVRDLTHVSQTTATEYLSTLVKSGSMKMEGKGKAIVYKNIFG